MWLEYWYRRMFYSFKVRPLLLTSDFGHWRLRLTWDHVYNICWSLRSFLYNMDSISLCHLSRTTVLLHMKNLAHLFQCRMIMRCFWSTFLWLHVRPVLPYQRELYARIMCPLTFQILLKKIIIMSQFNYFS